RVTTIRTLALPLFDRKELKLPFLCKRQSKGNVDECKSVDMCVCRGNSMLLCFHDSAIIASAASGSRAVDPE
ncbi:uncharacterized, partial [Tachysurus ichikawai]